MTQHKTSALGDPHLATGFTSFGLSTYDVTNCENWMPDLSFDSKMSSLLRNITNSTEARILLLHISCQSLKESVYMPGKRSALRKIIQWRRPTSRLMLSSSARTWLNPDIGARKMIMLTMSFLQWFRPFWKGDMNTIVKELSPSSFKERKAGEDSIPNPSLRIVLTSLASMSTNVVDCPFPCILVGCLSTNYVFFWTSGNHSGFQNVL